MMIAYALFATALAHKPVLGGPFPEPALAHEVGNPDISIVIYEELTCDVPQVWLSFVHSEPRELYVQLGVPEIPRLADHRPSIAVLSKGLPEPTGPLPFDVPEGYGVEVYDSAETFEPFFEPFTGTSSWVYVEETLQLPGAGRTYVVAWNPEDLTGKVWVALGTVEDFSDVEVSEFASWTQVVNDFHETGRFAEIPDIDERICVEPEVEEERGCSTAGAGWGWMALFGFAAVAGRRRRPRSGHRPD